MKNIFRCKASILLLVLAPISLADKSEEDIVMKSWSHCGEEQVETLKQSFDSLIKKTCGDDVSVYFMKCLMELANKEKAQLSRRCIHLKPDFTEIISIANAEKNGVSIPESADNEFINLSLKDLQDNNKDGVVILSGMIDGFGLPYLIENDKAVHGGAFYFYHLDKNRILKAHFVNKILSSVVVYSEDIETLVWEPSNPNK